MYYRDLSPYRYHGARFGKYVVHVGWLDARHQFEQGEVSQEFRDRLDGLLRDAFPAIRARCRVMRGYHFCGFCPSMGIEGDLIGGGRARSHAEVWIPGGPGYFATPELILHYVEAHRYQPPAIYIDAVLSLDLSVPFDAEAAARAAERADPPAPPRKRQRETG